MPPAVEITGLVKRYGDRVAVDGLDLTVPPAAVTAVLGPNGAGKTTTVEVCEGLRRADAGSVRVLGLDPARDRRRLRPRVGVMLQAGGVYPGATAGEMLRHVARLHADPADAAALAERLGISGVGRTAYRRLSGGEKQRLALALAVVGRPELVFLDEPTAGLDPQARHATWELIRELRSSGVTVVLTTHDMDEAEQLADTVAVVDGGRVIRTGTPAELTASAAGAVRLDGPEDLDVGGLAAALPAGCVVTAVRPGRFRVQDAGDTAGSRLPQLLAAIAGWCAAHDVLPRRLEVERRTLEDVFLDLTGRTLRA